MFDVLSMGGAIPDPTVTLYIAAPTHTRAALVGYFKVALPDGDPRDGTPGHMKHFAVNP